MLPQVRPSDRRKKKAAALDQESEHRGLKPVPPSTGPEIVSLNLTPKHLSFCLTDMEKTVPLLPT